MSRRIYYDTEFLEDGRVIDLISIGMIDEAGASYYAVNSQAPWPKIEAHEYVMRHVWPQLPLTGYDPRHRENPLSKHGRGILDRTDEAVKPRWVIAEEVKAFILRGSEEPQLWADFSSYDHVVLAQLWGAMAELPPGIPMRTRDVRQEIDRHEGLVLPIQDPRTEHHALYDAQHARALHIAVLEAEYAAAR
jgi:hypothetical protein